MCPFLSLDFSLLLGQRTVTPTEWLFLCVLAYRMLISVLWSDVFSKLYFIFPLVREVDIRLPSALHLHYNCIWCLLSFFFLVHRPSASPVRLLWWPGSSLSDPFNYRIVWLFHSVLSFFYFVEISFIWNFKERHCLIVIECEIELETERLTLGPVVRSCSHASSLSLSCLCHDSQLTTVITIEMVFSFLVGRIEPPCWQLLYLCIFQSIFFFFFFFLSSGRTFPPRHLTHGERGRISLDRRCVSHDKVLVTGRDNPLGSFWLTRQVYYISMDSIPRPMHGVKANHHQISISGARKIDRPSRAACGIQLYNNGGYQRVVKDGVHPLEKWFVSSPLSAFLSLSTLALGYLFPPLLYPLVVEVGIYWGWRKTDSNVNHIELLANQRCFTLIPTCLGQQVERPPTRQTGSFGSNCRK